MEQLAASLKTLKEEQKEFKKDNKDIFKRNTELNKAIKKASGELMTMMAKEEIETFEHDGMEFNVKKKKSESHDLDKLNELMGDTENFNKYMQHVQSEKVEVRTRKAKRQRND